MNRVLSDSLVFQSVSADSVQVADIAVAAPWWARSARVLVLAGADAFSLVLSVAVAYLIWAAPMKSQPWDLYSELLVLLPLFLFVYGAVGLYPGFGLGAVETLRRLTRSTTVVYLAIAGFSFAAKIPPTYSRAAFFISWAVSLGTVPIIRFIVLRRMKHKSWWPERAVTLGDRLGADRVLHLLGGAHSLGYAPVASMRVGSLDGEPRDAFCDGLIALAEQGVRVAFIIDDQAMREARVIEFLQEHFRHVIVIPSDNSLPVEGVVIRNLGGLLGVEFSNQLLLRRNMLIKRALDLAVGTVLFVTTLPIVVLSAALVKVISRGPAFYAQEREGLNGRRVKVWKIRSMQVDADARLQSLLDQDEAIRSEWERTMKLRDDPRIVPFIGRFIRKFSIDELPQLAQVVIGELSLVGPRPFPRYHIERFERDFQKLRVRVRPGLTGLWQISSRSDSSVAEQQRMDSHYIRNWSVWMDLYVLARTAGVVLSGRGAY